MQDVINQFLGTVVDSMSFNSHAGSLLVVVLPWKLNVYLAL